MIALSDTGGAFLLPGAPVPALSYACPHRGGAGSLNFPRGLAAADGNGGDSVNRSPSLSTVAAPASDRFASVADRLGAACCLTRGRTARAVDDPARAFSKEGDMASPKRESRLLDTMEFRRMWSEGMKPAEIGATVGLAAKSVEALARKYGYSPRWRGRLRGSMPEYPAIDDPARFENKPQPVQPAPQSHPRWPAEYDAAILKTAGKYSRIAKLSQGIGRPVNAILARWHQLRVG